ncbi:MAG: FAD-dependent thymidylate synthase [Ignavibacteriae bacterium]|nr:FAD-dependent thymidylate synthase [Ignavibacteriota bacterium]
MGDDAAIVQAARVSYGSGTKKVLEDRGLIRYLLRHAHTTPFEMVEFKFHVKLPIFVARQWIRHRTANVNEYSGRYSEMKDEFYTPNPNDIRPQSVLNKQGRSEETLPDGIAEQAANAFKAGQDEAYAQYQEFLEQGIAREIARINLPVSNYTEWYWKIDLHNLFHFLRLRIDSHAQYEIRVFAEAIAELVKPFVPHAWEAFEDYVLNAHRMTAPELKVLKHLLEAMEFPSDETLAELGLKGREAVEFKDKMRGMFR